MAYLKYQKEKHLKPIKHLKPNTMHTNERWLERFDAMIQKNLTKANFSNEKIADAIDISERHLFRKVKEKTGLSPQKYIRKQKLHLAFKLMETGQYKTVKGTATAIGYTNTSYFINQFEKEFGQKPLSVLKAAGWR
jgi:AraC-like DNA-binding protein